MKLTKIFRSLMLPAVPVYGRRPQKFLTAAICTYFSCSFLLAPAVLADDLVEGKSYYGKGEYNKAAESFKRVLEKNNGNSTAHYYMANCYVAKHDWGEAKAEYQQAAALTKDAKIRDYCLTVVATLEQSHPSIGSSRSPAGSSNSAFDEAQARGQAALNRSQSDVNNLMSQTDRQVRQLSEDRDNALAPLQGVNRAGAPLGSAEDRDAVRAPYDRRIEELRNQAQRRASDIQNQGESAARKAIRE